MVITDDRGALNASLQNATATVFILLGPSGTKAGEVHTQMNTKQWDPYQNYFLITNNALLTQEESQAWFDRNLAGFYVVLGGNNNPKKIAQKGSVLDLLKPDGTPDYLEILDIFLKGDEL
jgi:hypothetical protein